tara:strand:- start:379 stop:837 length:459 start_codon:yes stop_codon:yes gene_type:complete
MNEWLIVIFLSMLPFGELRASIPTGIALGLNPISVFIMAVIFNSLIIVAIWAILDSLHDGLMEFRLYSRLFNRYIEKSRKKMERFIGTEKEAWGVFLLTAIPFPLTGAYTAAILSWFFNLNRKMAAKAIVLGVFVAGLIVMGVSLGLLKWLF